MPDMWTHLIGGKLAAELVADTKWRIAIDTHRKLFYLGCQAPDQFYYHNFQPWKRDKIGNLVSAAIHAEKCQDFALRLIEGIDTQAASFESDVVFVLGFFCHWVVDRITHPYIHYISGFEAKRKASSVVSAIPHKRIELFIDVLMAKEHLGLKPYEAALIPYIDVGHELPPSIVTLLSTAIARTYPTIWSVQKGDFINGCYRDMLTSLSWLYDPHGHKKRYFWGVLDMAFGINSLSYFYPKVVPPNIDYLNESHQEWCHPACNAEVTTESFHDLFQRAIVESGLVMNSTLDYLGGNISHESWLDVVGNLSYSSGKDSSTYSPLIHSKPLPAL